MHSEKKWKKSTPNVLLGTKHGGQKIASLSPRAKEKGRAPLTLLKLKLQPQP
jgi:hypothetical protein